MGKVQIRPTVDCVFKAILGTEGNKPLLINFLNAVLGLHGNDMILDVTILNPYNEKHFKDNKLSIVDIKTKDNKGHHHQIDIQIAVNAWLPSRILYNWSGIYHSQLNSGHQYSKLKPTTSIWVLEDYLFGTMKKKLDQETDQYLHLNFQIYERILKFHFSDQLDIHLLQLPFLRKNSEISSDKDKWLYFFREGHTLDIDELPPFLNTEEFRQAMETLIHFSDDQKAFLLYQERLNAIREQETWQHALQQTKLMITQKNEELSQKNEELFQKNEELIQRDAQISQRDEQISQFQAEVRDLKALLMKQKNDFES